MKKNQLFFFVMILAAMLVFTGCTGTGKESGNSSGTGVSVGTSAGASTETSVGTSVGASTETTAIISDSTVTSDTGSVSSDQSGTGASEGTVSPEDGNKTETTDLTFYIVNQCGTKIGMVSTLDPVTGEQIDIGELEDGNSLVLNIAWPQGINTFALAIYNISGDLVSTSEIDITGARETVIVNLSGNGNLESITPVIN
ncbi:MAG: hypothetical protein K6E32_04310 [Lachnospiraceae bacterium]|nr:hypothetical protein [Lachnospiraceae bacterium]